MKSSSMAALTMASFLMLLVFLAPASVSAVTCSDVIKDLKPCVSYLQSGSGKPPAACCAGVSALASAVTTLADRKTACTCIKSAAGKISFNSQLAQALPGNCRIKSPVNISPNVDCSKIN